MFTYRANGARLCATLLILLFCSTAFAGSARVEVCHIPPDNPDSYHTIKVSDKALANHLAHGDLAGACEAGCAVLCDDGDACTIDDTGDCYQNGCPIDRNPADCSDGVFCTADSCDSIEGCQDEAFVCTPTDLCHVSICNEYDEGCSETPVICGDGFACDPGTGDCVADDEPYCECFDSADLQALGEISSCGDYPSSGVAVIDYTNGNLACSGEGCTLSAVGCGVKDGEGFLEIPLSDEENADCRALIAGFCASASVSDGG